MCIRDRSYTWRNLEMTDDVGNPYYYYVKELTAITGYTAEYDTNGASFPAMPRAT